MFNSLKSIFNKPVKNTAVNPLAQAMETIEKAKASSIVNEQSAEDRYSELFNKGIFYLRKFSDTTANDDLELLQKAAEFFTETFEIKKNRVEPYFYLAHIFYLINEVEQALKYIKIATFIDSNFPGLEHLKLMISNPVKEIYAEENTIVVKKPAAGTVTSISYKQIRAKANTKLVNKLGTV